MGIGADIVGTNSFLLLPFPFRVYYNWDDYQYPELDLYDLSSVYLDGIIQVRKVFLDSWKHLFAFVLDT